MQRLLTGTGVALALMIVGPAWAQLPPTTPSTAAGSPNMPSSVARPSTPTIVPYPQQAPAMPQAQPYTQAPAQQAPYAQQTPMPAPAPAASTGATMAAEPADSGRGLPRHRHSMRSQHARGHGKHITTASRRGARSSDNVADQLNRDEAGRLASGNMATGSSMPSQTPPAGAPMPGGSMSNAPMSNAPMSNPPPSAGQLR